MTTSMKRRVVLVSAAVSAAAVAFVGTVTAVAHVQLAGAQEKCHGESASVELTDLGSTIAVQADSARVPFCVINELRPTQAVVWHLEGTRPLDGWQEDSWSIYTAKWSTDPDEGIQLVVSTSWGL